jgi:hypothetical protein
MSNEEEIEFMDCYEVEAADGITIKSTRMNENNSWFFGLFPKDDKGNTNQMVMIIMSIMVPLVILTLIYIVLSVLKSFKISKSNTGLTGGRRR